MERPVRLRPQLDSTALTEGEHQLAVVATAVDGGQGSASMEVTADNEADPAVTVFVVDVDQHTHARGRPLGRARRVQVADSSGSSLRDA